MKLSIIVPCYNEAAGIPQLKERLPPIVRLLEKSYNVELIFVDDGSTDNTNELLRKSFVGENIKIIKSIYKKLKNLIKANSINDEGAWQTSLSNEEILSLLSKFKDIKIGLDIAASTFYKNNSYIYESKYLNKKAQIFYINLIINKYNIFYIEDPLQEEDFEWFREIIKSSRHLIVGDDLTATQIPRLKKAIKEKSINAMIIKPNQNGSLIELKQIFQICKKHNVKTILSHRSGETLDNALADYAVGFGADFIKCGIATKWREAKLNRLIQISNLIK